MLTALNVLPLTPLVKIVIILVDGTLLHLQELASISLQLLHRWQLATEQIWASIQRQWWPVSLQDVQTALMTTPSVSPAFQAGVSPLEFVI